MRSMDSFFKWQRKHLFTKDHPLLFKWSKVKTFAHVASQAKKSTSSSTQEFQITPAGKEIVHPSSKSK